MDNINLLPQVVTNSTQVLSQLQSGQLLKVDSSRKGGFIICKRHHAEFAGPGAAIGGLFDLDCTQLIPIGDASISCPNSYEERQKAFTIRQQWSYSLQQATEPTVPLQRAIAGLNLLADYFDAEIVAQIPDEILAQLVGVLPRTIKMVRQPITPHSSRKPYSNAVSV